MKELTNEQKFYLAMKTAVAVDHLRKAGMLLSQIYAILGYDTKMQAHVNKAVGNLDVLYHYFHDLHSKEETDHWNGDVFGDMQNMILMLEGKR